MVDGLNCLAFHGQLISHLSKTQPKNLKLCKVLEQSQNIESDSGKKMTHALLDKQAYILRA